MCFSLPIAATSANSYYFLLVLACSHLHSLSLYVGLPCAPPTSFTPFFLLCQPCWNLNTAFCCCCSFFALSCFRLLILLTTAYLGLFLLLLLLFAVTAYMLAYYWLYITSCCLPLSTFAHFHYIPYSILYFICVYSYVFHHTPCIIDCNFHGLLNLLNFRFLSQDLTGVGF